ncbi:polysaccharide pyruvyl transferase WcaK-like protein [Saccharopolyspora lacisalsi]|uniref:Polysaccharide pyruvyl transferase WcaK-like protein n=1 Tax=Halosaccharopolyspora lacisalsi TaxID=1000566 RepID=A0A839E0R7_9PSEU|nr:polysaccharide pyruvyl transferase family protein [Halosaccharopolyspora lacisalsi]MBA8825265.1 polysaccharide pyruvyl transferase WcaK-like protein [Halosaccharopolyspora lacisalsi]
MSSSDPSAPAVVYLVGTTGNPNYGDELIGATWLKYLARTAPETEVWLDCPNPGQSEVLLGHLHPRARFTDTFWRLCWEAPSEEPWQVAAFVQHAVNDPGLAPRWVAGIELAATADVVHLIGGGYVNGIWPRHIGLLAAAVAAVRRSGGRAAMTGQGLWPVPENAHALLRSLADQFEIIDVRDEPSSAPLSTSLRPSVTGDDMFFGIEPGLFREDETREIMVCVQSDLLDVSVPSLAGFLLDTLRAWGVSSEQVGLVEGIPRVDREVFSLVEHDLPNARFYPFSEITSSGLPATAGQCWLSTRFHTHLMAAAAGAGGVAVSINSGYYTNKHRSLIERGSNWALSEGLSIPEPPVDGGFDPADLRTLHDHKAQLARSIYSPHLS